MSTAPNRRAERALWDAGFNIVVGIDEVGKGAWAGPLTVGAAVLPTTGRVLGVRDSKMLSEAKREGLYDRLQAWCTAWSVGHASQEECDRLGMAAAQRLAARRAIEALGVLPDAAIVDGKWNFMSGLVAHVEMVVKADATCLPVSVASVLAKVTRDRIMRSESQHYPQYHFDDNKGYPCPRHRAALAGYGPSAIHRRSWVFMEKLPFTGVERLAPGGQASLFP